MNATVHRVCWLVGSGLLAAACSSASAGSDIPVPTATSQPPTVAAGEPAADGAAAEAAPTSPPTTATAPSSTAPPTTEAPTTSTLAGTGVATTVAPTVLAPVVDDEAGMDEPVFVVPPQVDLDFGVPVDDAGLPADTPMPVEQLTGWAGFDASLEQQLLRNGNTAASVAVSIGGDIVHSAAFGQRAFDPADGAATNDRFRIASISKPITSIALLQLVEEGVVGLDEPVGDLVAFELGITSPAARVGSITVRQLLSHTAGFGKYDGVFFRGQAADCREAATIGLTRSLSSTPGGSYRYSNMNYCVAGLLIEALTGRSYEAVVYERLLTPLGLSGLRLAPTFDPGPDEILHPTTLGRNYMETLAASGAWVATPEDLVTIFDSLDTDTPGWKPLEPATLSAMLDPVGGEPGQRGYGLGLIMYGGGRYGHTGTIESTHAMVLDRGDGVIWAVTVSGPYPDDTPRLESIVNRAFVAGGFVAG